MSSSIKKNTKCLVCKSDEQVSFFSEYKLEIKEDRSFFENALIYHCKKCNFGFTNPMPSKDKLDYFYKKIYRSKGRPPFFVSENEDDQKKYYLEDKNLSYLLYITSIIDLTKIKKLYDFGGGVGDLGFALKKKFPNLDLYCTEGDSHCEKILKERGFKNYKNIDEISNKFDLITTTHSLEHLTDISIFKKFKEMLNPGGHIFFEVPNCTNEYWVGRIYDSPHLLFYTKKSIEKLSEIYGFEIINFSYSAYSFSKDHQSQKDSQDKFYADKNNFFSANKIKQTIKKFIPKKIISLRQDFLKIKNVRSDDRLNWFVNNTGDNCYIRGILKKNKSD